MLLSSNGPLALKWNYIPRMFNWFLHYFKNCNTKSMLHTAKYMHQILSLSNDAYDEIFQEIDTNDLVEKKGIIYVWTNKNLKSRKLEIKVRNDLGIEQKPKLIRSILIHFFRLQFLLRFFNVFKHPLKDERVASLIVHEKFRMRKFFICLLAEVVMKNRGSFEIISN